LNRRTFLGGLTAAGATLGLTTSHRVRAAGTPTALPLDEWARPDWFTSAENAVAIQQHRVMVASDDEYNTAHIPYADHIDWQAIDLKDSRPETVKAWADKSIQVAMGHGITSDGDLVIVDVGTLYAPRLFWVLSYLGRESMSVLDGGTPAWAAAGGPLEQGPVIIDYVQMPPWDLKPDDSVLATLEDVSKALDKGKTQFIDARTEKEFRDGHLPGAVNIPFLDNSVDSKGGAWKSIEDLNAMYSAKGIDRDTAIIPYCTTGVRSAATWFTLNALGYKDVRLFSGSWREWSADTSRPIETGTPAD
jgi:thiosulfate/3-mercaptopyruvate sulfurtransferase